MAAELPPLPEPAKKVVYNESKGYAFDAYTADQMHAYARAAIAELAARLRSAATGQRPPV